MSSALRNYNATNSVSKPLAGMKANNGGGYTYTVGDRDRLTRFLVLGVDGGTYYVSEKELTSQNVSWLEKLIHESPELVLDVVLDVSTNGRAYRNSAAIFTLALMLNQAPDNYKSQVVDAVSKVARTAT